MRTIPRFITEPTESPAEVKPPAEYDQVRAMLWRGQKQIRSGSKVSPSRRVYSLDQPNVIFYSVAEAAKAFNIKYTTLYGALMMKRRCKGRFWRFVD